ncbi:hypothetical protein VB264_07550 [Arcicella aquatica]|uniref:Uncharacterized protein n=1 Tax=Arcicella aquatica TaxID=217141 RepID=A0ABU5QKR8_9BACT|nr:hypothetical protein [Arcicella aquatica]MEA5257633.1 hypothetical protein [Arcicella aquatica]
MIILTDKDLEILVNNSLSNREEIYNKIHFKVSFEEFKQILFSLKDDVEHIDLFSIIYWLLPHSMSKNEFEELNTIFLKEKWHNGHDDMVGMFQVYFYDNPKNIDTILHIMNDLPEFYRYDTCLKHPFIRKCIYAIGAQPEPYNIQALEALLEKETEEELIEYLEEQIETRKTDGRWEARRPRSDY